MSHNNADSVAAVMAEKIKDLHAFCIANKVPAVFMYAIEKKHKTNTEVIVLSPMRLGVDLTEDKISPMVALIGTDKFKIVPIKTEEIFDEESYYPDDVE